MIIETHFTITLLASFITVLIIELIKLPFKKFNISSLIWKVVTICISILIGVLISILTNYNNIVVPKGVNSSCFKYILTNSASVLVTSMTSYDLIVKELKRIWNTGKDNNETIQKK